jgi:hypothetical protein
MLKDLVCRPFKIFRSEYVERFGLPSFKIFRFEYVERFGLPSFSLEMPVPSQGHYGFHSFPVVD